MLREYEFTVISKADLPENEKKDLWSKYEGMLIKDGGEVLLKDDWGVRKLAFPIKKEFRGHYLHFDFVGKPQNLSEVERLMRIDDRVLRYLSVNIGENIDIPTRRADIAKERAKASAQSIDDIPPITDDELDSDH